MTTLINGLLGGAVIGTVATVAAFLESDDGAVSADGPRWKSAFAGVAYGTAGGWCLVALELFVLGVIGVPPSVVEAYSVAVIWAGVLFALALGARRLVPDPPRLTVLLVYHVVLGLGLGLWIRLTWIT